MCFNVWRWSVPQAHLAYTNENNQTSLWLTAVGMSVLIWWRTESSEFHKKKKFLETHISSSREGIFFTKPKAALIKIFHHFICSVFLNFNTITAHWTRALHFEIQSKIYLQKMYFVCHIPSLIIHIRHRKFSYWRQVKHKKCIFS
jgi:hypothetical protein